MKKNKYKLSFTTGGLFYSESLKIVELLFNLNDWKKVREISIKTNILQARTESTARKILSEIYLRLKLLNSKELELLKIGTLQEQKQILWLAVCRRYSFISDFMIEVVREKIINLQDNISYLDYDSFVYNKESLHEELEQISDSTKKKLRQVLFRMLRETEIIDNKEKIIPAVFSDRIVKIISENNINDFVIFPVTEQNLKDLFRNVENK